MHDGMVKMSVLWVLPLIALVSTIFLIWIVYSRARMNLAARIWILMMFLFLLWTVGEFAQKWLGDVEAVFQWTALVIVFGDLFPAIFLIFTLVFPIPNQFFMTHQKVLTVLIVGPKMLSMMITFILGDFSADEGYEDDGYGYVPLILILKHQVSSNGLGLWYFYLGLAHTFILLALGAFVLVRNYTNSSNESDKRAIQIILIGFSTYLIIGGLTGFILPLMGYFPPELVSLGVLLMNTIVAYGLLQDQAVLFSPTTETEETRDYSDTLQIGDFYLCSINQGIDTFTELVSHGYEGLYVGAVKPNLELTKFKRTPIVILTEAGKGLRQYGNLQYVPADELKTFKNSIFTFVASAKKGIIFLDNMDVILEKGWAPPDEFVEMGLQMRDASIVNTIWLFGTRLKDDKKITKIRNVMDYPVVKKAIVLDKLNSILKKIDVSRHDLDEQLKRLGRVEPIFYYLKAKDDKLVYNDDIADFVGLLTTDTTNVIRLFVQQFQSKIPMASYKDILNELRDYGISRFEFLLRSGDSYLIEEAFEDKGRTYEVYQDLLERGFDGICITRTEPNKLRQRYLLPQENEIFWLTQDRKEDHDIKPAPEYIMVHIKNFIESHKTEPGVLLLDGLEYLITFQGDQFESYLKVMRRISDLISQSKIIMLIPYDPAALSAERIAIFRRSGIEVISRDMLK
jgi:hypothetical protein